MNSTKTNRVCVCRGCRQEFTVEARNQQYCAHCREVRAQAMEALRVKVCRHCHVERGDCKNGICPDCREARRQREDAETERIAAAKLARYNAKGGCTCGRLATHTDDGLCDECHTKRMDDMRQRIRQKRRDDYDKRREEEAAKSALLCNECGRPFHPVGVESRCQACMDVDNNKFMVWFESLSDDDQEYALNSLKDFAASLDVRAGTASPPTVEEVNPEEIAHDNQDAIDSAFASLMEGIDL